VRRGKGEAVLGGKSQAIGPNTQDLAPKVFLPDGCALSAGKDIPAEGDYTDRCQSHSPGGEKEPAYVEDEYFKHIHGIVPRGMPID
jgi:hypothetical protein